MIYIKKSQPEPLSLAEERVKPNGSYRTEEILERLKIDFHNKCYICENKNPLSINVEHFKSHQGDKTLEFDWQNLFWSCSHCNNIKLALYDDILNCTDVNDDVENSIKLKIDPLPFTEVEVIPLRADPKVNKTVALLNKVYSGNTPLKKIESQSLRDLIVQEILQFINNLNSLFTANTDGMKRYYLLLIEEQLHDSSSFTSFKRWIIKENPEIQNKISELVVSLKVS